MNVENIKNNGAMVEMLKAYVRRNNFTQLKMLGVTVEQVKQL